MIVEPHVRNRRRRVLRVAGLLAVSSVAAILTSLALTWSPPERDAHRPAPAGTPNPGPTGAGTAFPHHCRHTAYCELGSDSICTILYLAEETGTPLEDILYGLAGEVDRGRLAADDFAGCPQYLPYFDVMLLNRYR